MNHEMGDSHIPPEPDASLRRRQLRRRLVRSLLAAACLLILFCAGGTWWWTSRSDIGDAVREAGGRYRRETFGTPMSVLGNLINRRPTTVFHWIEFAPGNLDDAWLHAHGEEIGSLPYLILSLRDTRLTGEGLSALRGMQNLRLQQALPGCTVQQLSFKQFEQVRESQWDTAD